MNERNTNKPTMSSTQQQYLLTCEKCDSIVPDKYLSGTRPDELWVECSCGAHNGWYCPNHSPGNDCWCDEKCDCCNPEEEIKDVVFNCFTCGIPVIRDSEAHNHSKFDEQNEDNWYCPYCPTPITEEDAVAEEDDASLTSLNEECCDCGTPMSEKKLTEEEFDEYPDRDPGYDNDGEWRCGNCRGWAWGKEPLPPLGLQCNECLNFYEGEWEEASQKWTTCPHPHVLRKHRDA